MKLFIAYNTTAVLEIAINKYMRLLEIKSTLPKDVFNSIVNYYKKRGRHSLYIDILCCASQNANNRSFANRNKEEISNSDAVIFLVAKNEISFWQLQENFFASYYNKPIIYINCSKAMRLLVHNMLDKYIELQLNINHNHYLLRCINTLKYYFYYFWNIIRIK